MSEPTPRRRRWLPWAILAIVLLLLAGAYAYFDLFAPDLEASGTASAITAELPTGSSADQVDAWLATRDFKTFNIPGPAGKRAGIGAVGRRQTLFRHWELWVEFYFDADEKLASSKVTAHTDGP